MILGMTLRTKPEEIYRALIEATAYGMRMVVENYRENGVAVDEVKEYEQRLFAKLENEHGDWLATIEAGHYDDNDEQRLRAILAEMQV